METKGAHRGFSEKHPEGDTPLLPGRVGIRMNVLQRHIRVGVYTMHSGNWEAMSFQQSMWRDNKEWCDLKLEK